MRNINLFIITILIFASMFIGCFIFGNRLPIEDVTQSDCEPISDDKADLIESFEFILNGDSLIINHYNAMRHCGYDVKFIAEQNESSIIVRETDLAQYQAGCTCYLNFSVTIPNLENGSYHVELWNNDTEKLYEDDITVE